MNTQTELIGFSAYYNEELKESEYKHWNVNDFKKEYNHFIDNNDIQGADFMAALALKRGVDIENRGSIAEQNQAMYEMHRKNTLACLGKI